MRVGSVDLPEEERADVLPPRSAPEPELGVGPVLQVGELDPSAPVGGDDEGALPSEREHHRVGAGLTPVPAEEQHEEQQGVGGGGEREEAADHAVADMVIHVRERI